MDKVEYLLVCLAEEAGEIVQAVGKAIRFGLADEYRGETNRERLVAEINDLLAIVEMLDVELSMPQIGNEAKLEAKKAKVEKYMEYSRQIGALI